MFQIDANTSRALIYLRNRPDMVSGQTGSPQKKRNFEYFGYRSSRFNPLIILGVVHHNEGEEGNSDED